MNTPFILSQYIADAMSQADCDKLEDGTFVDEINARRLDSSELKIGVIAQLG